MDWLTHAVAGLNVAANYAGRVLDPIGLLPGWLSATLVAVGTGILMLALFKYTSNQGAIRRVRRSIRANLLAVSLFKDSVGVGLLAQGRILLGALRLLLLALVPLLVLIVPTVLLLAQIGLWYQARPLAVGDEAVVVLKLNGPADAPLPKVALAPSPAVATVAGPVRVVSQREVCWNVKALQPGYHTLTFQVEGQDVAKELAVGDGDMRVSIKRPGWDWSEVLLHPREEPFGPASPVQSIAVEYAARPGWMTGTDYWIIYWLVVSLVAGFLFKGLLGVHL